MRRNKVWCVLLGVVIVGGCAASGAPMQTTTVEGSLLRVDLGEFVVDAGDTETCFSTGFVTDREYAIGAAAGLQGEGGHHITVYWTTDMTEYAPRPCTEADMLSWNFIAGTGGEPGLGDDQSPPDGLAFRVPAGVHIVVQSHYINASGSAQRVRDVLEVELVPPETLVAFAAMFAFNDGTFEVPPHARYRRVSECTMAESRSLVLLLGHMHDNGRNLSIEILRADGLTTETLYDHAWQSSYTAHPPVVRWPIDAPLELRPGDRVRQTCEWENVSSDPLVFPIEMCATVAYYFPDVGEGSIGCAPTVVSTETL